MIGYGCLQAVISEPVIAGHIGYHAFRVAGRIRQLLENDRGEGDRFVFLGGNFTFQDDLRLERCRQARYDDQKKNGDKSGVSHSCGV